MVVEVEVGLGVCYYEVEAEVDAPEGEEETWILGLMWNLGLGNGVCEMIMWGNDGDLTLIDRMYVPADIRRNGTSLNISRPS